MIGDCMKRQVSSVSPGTTVLGAARLVVDRHIGTLPVVDEQGTLIGVVRVQDILDIFMPDFVRLLEDIDFIHDFGVLETLLPKDLPDAAHLTMRDLMQEPVSVEQTCGLLRAFAIMLKHDIRDLPVVNQVGALVGIASLVDIAAKFLATWAREEAAS
jgi:CBS-domain-containing membrane protein